MLPAFCNTSAWPERFPPLPPPPRPGEAEESSKSALAADERGWSMSSALAARIVLHPLMSCLSRFPCVHLHSSTSLRLHSFRRLRRRSSGRRRDDGR
eukprot:4622398-Pleurochrysis_carterae.AAC.1